MADLIVYYAHPGHRHSRVNRAMRKAIVGVEGFTSVDLYADYPRYNIEIDREQARLLAHDVILLQFPLFWYSAPALVKNWIDLVFEHGFAYGAEGTKLEGKSLILAVSAGGPEEAYGPAGYNGFPLRTLLTPFEQTARLCGMTFLPPFVFFDAVRAEARRSVTAHAEGFRDLVLALRDDTLDTSALAERDLLRAGDLPILAEAR